MNRRIVLAALAFLTTISFAYAFDGDNGTGDSPFPEGYFYLTLKGHEGLALEAGAINDNGTRRPAFMEKRAVTGMAWKAIDAGDGYYFLSTEADEELRLEGGSFVKGGAKGGGAEMNNAKATGQMWKAEKAGDGIFYLHSKFGGEEQFLMAEPETDAVPHMADGTQTDKTTGKWVFVPME